MYFVFIRMLDERVTVGDRSLLLWRLSSASKLPCVLIHHSLVC